METALLSAWTFDSPARAAEAATELASVDGVRTWSVITWPRHRFAPRTAAAAPGAPAGEDLWHLLLGLAYLLPLVAPRAGLPVEPTPTWELIGVHRGFTNTLRDHLAPGGSQLVALVDPAAETAVDTTVEVWEPVHHMHTGLEPEVVAAITGLYLVP